MSEQRETQPVDRAVIIGERLDSYANAVRPAQALRQGAMDVFSSLGYNHHTKRLSVSPGARMALAPVRDLLMVGTALADLPHKDVGEELIQAIAGLDPYLPRELVDPRSGEVITLVDLNFTTLEQQQELENALGSLHQTSEAGANYLEQNIAKEEVAKIWKEERLDDFTKMVLQLRVEAGEDARGIFEEIEAGFTSMRALNDRLIGSTDERLLITRTPLQASHTTGSGLYIVPSDQPDDPYRTLVLSDRAAIRGDALQTYSGEKVKKLIFPSGALSLLVDSGRDILIGQAAIADHLRYNPSNSEHVRSLFSQLGQSA